MPDGPGKVWAVVSKPTELTDDDLDLLRRNLNDLSRMNTDSHASATVRAGIETIGAIRKLTVALNRFDEASGALVNTTNKLTTKILRLTWASLVVALISLVVAAVALFK